MKAYTDLEQSKKLAEILPLESADMCYRIVAYNPNDTPEYQPYCFYGTLSSDIPCWSLSALLGLIPKPLLGQHLESEYWECTTWEDFNVVKEVHGQDNPLDAAFEIVVWLKENGKL